MEYLYHCRQCQWDLCCECVKKEEDQWKEKNQLQRFEEEKEGEKEKLAKEQLEKLELDQEDLTETIQVSVSILNSDDYEE